jgi:ubiquitin C-terminal hydrolase
MLNSEQDSEIFKYIDTKLHKRTKKHVGGAGGIGESGTTELSTTPPAEPSSATPPVEPSSGTPLAEPSSGAPLETPSSGTPLAEPSSGAPLETPLNENEKNLINFFRSLSEREPNIEKIYDIDAIYDIYDINDINEKKTNEILCALFTNISKTKKIFDIKYLITTLNKFISNILSRYKENNKILYKEINIISYYKRYLNNYNDDLLMCLNLHSNGFQNLGKTCYVNAILQLLLYLLYNSLFMNIQTNKGLIALLQNIFNNEKLNLYKNNQQSMLESIINFVNTFNYYDNNVKQMDIYNINTNGSGINFLLNVLNIICFELNNTYHYMYFSLNKTSKHEFGMNNYIQYGMLERLFCHTQIKKQKYDGFICFVLYKTDTKTITQIISDETKNLEKRMKICNYNQNVFYSYFKGNKYYRFIKTEEYAFMYQTKNTFDINQEEKTIEFSKIINDKKYYVKYGGNGLLKKINQRKCLFTDLQKFHLVEIEEEEEKEKKEKKEEKKYAVFSNLKEQIFIFKLKNKTSNKDDVYEFQNIPFYIGIEVKNVRKEESLQEKRDSRIITEIPKQLSLKEKNIEDTENNKISYLYFDNYRTYLNYNLIGFVFKFGEVNTGHYTTAIYKNTNEDNKDIFTYYNDDEYPTLINLQYIIENLSQYIEIIYYKRSLESNDDLNDFLQFLPREINE